MSIEAVKERCHVDDVTGCWEWKGGVCDGRWPRIWAPNLSKPGAPTESQPGRRAVWQMVSGKAIPKGYRVHSKCHNPLCVNPDHMRCGTNAEWGAQLKRSGIYKGKAARVLANRATGRARSHLTPELIDEIIRSPETGEALAARLGISRSIVSKARRGEARSFHAAGNPFSGLMTP